jgi:hypothetical protein
MISFMEEINVMRYFLFLYRGKGGEERRGEGGPIELTLLVS